LTALVGKVKNETGATQLIAKLLKYINGRNMPPDVSSSDF
jgi:hypothetical protein